ncbi:unnamed protein product [Musa acuminata var. zebrina]
MTCIKSRPLPTAQCTPGHPCPKPSDSFSRATTAAFLGDRLSSSPSANSGRNGGGVFLR